MTILNQTPTPDLVALKTEIEPQATTLAGKLAALAPVDVCAANYAHFAAFLAEVKGIYKRLDEREKLITKPMTNALESTRVLFRPAKETCKKIEDMIKAKFATYDTATAERVDAAQIKAGELAAAGDAAGAQAVLAAVSLEDSAVDAVDGLSIRDAWDFEIVNVQIMPQGFVLPNLPLVRREMQRQVKQRPGEAPEIAGVRFFQKKIVASGSK